MNVSASPAIVQQDSNVTKTTNVNSHQFPLDAALTVNKFPWVRQTGGVPWVPNT